MKFRYSELQTFHRCQKMYEYRHILGLPDGSDKSADLLFGTAIHLALQDLFEGGNGIDCFNIFWHDLEYKDLEYSRLGHKELYNLGDVFISRFERLHKHHFEPVYLEIKQECPLGNGHTLSGTTDMIGKYKGKLSVIDYKTSAYPYDAYKIECNEQMYGYAQLAQKNFGMVIEQLVYVVFVKNPKEPRIQVIVKDLTQDKLSAMMENVTITTEAVENCVKEGRYIRNSGACVMGKKICPYFTKCFGK